MSENLICPLLGDFYEDPITVPCCGKSFSREALIDDTIDNRICPNCRGDLRNFNMNEAPPNRVLIDLVEEYISANDAKRKKRIEQKPNKNGHIWKSEIIPITETKSRKLKSSDGFNSLNDLVSLSELRLTVLNSKYAIRPVLNIWLVDVSGSMRDAWPQVKSALLYIMGMVSNNPMLKTVIVPYSHIAKSFVLTGNPSIDEPKIVNMYDSGGTHFRNAFIEAGKILQTYICSDSEEDLQKTNNVSSANIFFMTDGQDGSGSQDTLCADLVNIINSGWNGPYTIHSIGFSNGCNSKLLENMRTENGTFRYADPSDDADTLCTKLQSLFDMASKSTSVDVHVVLDDRLRNLNNEQEFIIKMSINPLLQGHYQTWVKDTTTNLNNVSFAENENKSENESENELKTFSLKVNTPLEKDYEVISVQRPYSNKIYDKWLKNVLDSIANELLEISKNISKNSMSNDKQLHICLILLQLEKIATKCSDTERIEFLTQQALGLKRGEVLDTNRLNDMRFGSKFTQIVPKQNNKPKTNPNNSYVPTWVPPKISNTPEWTEHNVYYTQNYEQGLKLDRNKLQLIIMNNDLEHYSMKSTGGKKIIRSEIEKVLSDIKFGDICHTDDDENNALMLAAYCGFQLVLKFILDKFKDQIGPTLLNETNKDNESAITLAIKKRGYHNSMNMLLEAGAIIPSHRLKGLQKYALSEGYTRTGEFLAAAGMDVTIADESMKPNEIKFMFARALKEKKKINAQSYLNTALKYAINESEMMKIVKTLLDQQFEQSSNCIETDENEKLKIDLPMFRKYCMPPKPDFPEIEKYIKLHKYILEKFPELLNEIDSETRPGSEDTLLIIVIENGNLPLVELCLDLGAEIEKENELGNSPLWIATAKRWPCIVDELINRGADVNHENQKGNSPLYASCLCGPRKIAETLIIAGADPEHRNENNDTLVLSCCRNGQPEVLELILEQVDPEIVKHRPEIDGFNAVMASAETKSKNGAECLQVLFNYGVDINEKTADDNSLLPGSTALHIAAYYNNVLAAQKLIELGADINITNVDGQTALHIAVIQGNLNIIKILRNTRNISDNLGNTPIAYCRNNEEIKDLLVHPMNDSMMLLSKGGFTSDEQSKATEILLNKSSIVGCLTTNEIANITPELLINSVIYREFNIIECLLKMGANPINTTVFDMTALVMVKWLNNAKIKNLFMSSGYDINDPNFMENGLSAYTNLKKSSDQSLVNKSILSLISKPQNKLLNSESQNQQCSGINVRMTEFINDVNRVSTLIPRIEDKSRSAIDILKKTKVEKNILDNYERYVWYAKLHTINLVANYENLLNPAEILALVMYSNNSMIAPQINQIIMDNQSQNWLYPYVQQLLTALDKLPNYEREVFIGAENINRSVFMIGNEISWSNLRSTSTMWRVATEQVPNFVDGKKRHGTVFIIKSKTGKLIVRYSQHPTDSEVIIMPGTKFKVTAWYQPSLIALGQENIREYSYGIKPEGRDDYLTHRALIIELTEIQ